MCLLPNTYRFQTISSVQHSFSVPHLPSQIQDELWFAHRKRKSPSLFCLQCATSCCRSLIGRLQPLVASYPGDFRFQSCPLNRLTTSRTQPRNRFKFQYRFDVSRNVFFVHRPTRQARRHLECHRRLLFVVTAQTCFFALIPAVVASNKAVEDSNSFF